MKAVFEKKEKNTVHFNMEISSEAFEKAVQDAYMKTRGRFNIPGFRKGKVPRKIIEMNYGEEVFFEDAVNSILPNAYSHAIEQLELDPVDSPEVDVETIEKDQPIKVKFSVDVKPEVKLGDYTTIELEKVDYSVTEDMILAKLEQDRDMNSRMIDASDRQVQEGDTVTIDFIGYLDGQPFEGGDAEGQSLEIGKGQFIPGFEEGLVGKKKDEEVELDVTFPEEYHEESLAGKPVVFKVKINEIKTKELPELDDEFAKDISEFDTLDEYKDSIKKELDESLKNQEKIETENKTVEKVVEMSEIDIPEAMIESQVESEIKDFEHRIKQQGFEMDQYLELTGTTKEDLSLNFRPMAEKRVKADLVLEAIAKAENIEATEEDLDVELDKLAEQYSKDNKERFIKDMKKGDTSFLKVGIVNTKVLDMLMKNVKFI